SHTDAATIARPLVDPDLVRQLSLVTVAGRRHEPAAVLIRTIRAHAWQAESASLPHSRPSAVSHPRHQRQPLLPAPARPSPCRCPPSPLGNPALHEPIV